jgi:phage-related protein
MALDLTGASLTTAEVKEISTNIKTIGENIDKTMQSVNSIMTTITGDSEGGLIDQTVTAVQNLNELCATLVAGIMNIGLKIGDYLVTMINQDEDAASALRRSIESRL